MKKIILLLIMILCFVDSNAQSSTQKWDSAFQRWEYFDSNGRMIGYQKWSSAFNRWEYYSTMPKQSQRKNIYEDIEYVSPYNFDLMHKGLQMKQAQYDKAETAIQVEIDAIFDIIYFVEGLNGLTENQAKAANKFNDALDEELGDIDIVANYRNIMK